jgi:hypothetical protein
MRVGEHLSASQAVLQGSKRRCGPASENAEQGVAPMGDSRPDAGEIGWMRTVPQSMLSGRRTDRQACRQTDRHAMALILPQVHE